MFDESRCGSIGITRSGGTPRRRGWSTPCRARRPTARSAKTSGDRDPDGAAVRAVLDAQRVVEVAGGLRIDRREPPIAQIDAVGEIAGPELLRAWPSPARRAVVGELERHHGAREDLLDLGARIVRIAEHLEHALEHAAGGVRGSA